MSFFTDTIKTFLLGRVSETFTNNNNREITGLDAGAVISDLIEKIDTVGTSTIVTHDVVGDWAHTVPATTLLTNMVIIPNQDGIVLIGDTMGGDSIYDYDGYTNELELADVKYYFEVETVIYFTGTFKIKFKQESYV